MSNIQELKADDNYQALQQAAQWFATLNDENATSEQHEQLQLWLAKDEQHRIAWQFVDKVGQRFSQTKQNLPNAPISKALQAARKDRINRRQALGCIATIGLFGFLAGRYTPVWQYGKHYAATWSSDYHTAVGETKEITLNDGGTAWLNTASAIKVNYQQAERLIDLVAGEVFISTAKDKQNRPFIVKTRHGQLQALGTQFSVHQQNEHTVISVFEGAVKVSNNQGKSLTLMAGQQSAFDDKHIGDIETADRSHQAWTKGVLVADDISLAEFILQINRYRYGYINLAPEVANLRIVGSYPLNDIDRTLSMIADVLPIKVTHVMPWWTSIIHS